MARDEQDLQIEYFIYLRFIRWYCQFKLTAWNDSMSKWTGKDVEDSGLALTLSITLALPEMTEENHKELQNTRSLDSDLSPRPLE